MKDISQFTKLGEHCLPKSKEEAEVLEQAIKVALKSKQPRLIEDAYQTAKSAVIWARIKSFLSIALCFAMLGALFFLSLIFILHTN